MHLIKSSLFSGSYFCREREEILIIPKTIGNRKRDCAWSCSRWQTQPEKICKSQRTNQCHSLRTLYWFVLCNFLIFSGCVCHLEQLHAQSPFLFPIVFGINLIPFFDICSVDYYCSFTPVVRVTESGTLLLLLFVSAKFCDFGIPTILRVLIFAISRSRAKFCGFAQAIAKAQFWNLLA